MGPSPLLENSSSLHISTHINIKFKDSTWLPVLIVYNTPVREVKLYTDPRGFLHCEWNFSSHRQTSFRLPTLWPRFTGAAKNTDVYKMQKVQKQVRHASNQSGMTEAFMHDCRWTCGNITNLLLLFLQSPWRRTYSNSKVLIIIAGCDHTGILNLRWCQSPSSSLCVCVCACMCLCVHACFCVCMCMCACMWKTAPRKL